MAAVVTSLRPAARGVEVELDGSVWRTLPAAAVVEAGLGEGLALDRTRIRALARALRRVRAERIAVAAVARREHSQASLDERLVRAGVSGAVRDEVLERARREGLVDDARFAERRASLLAERGAGDGMVYDDLVRQGVGDTVARAAVEALPPEAERVGRIVDQRGSGARTVRYLASRGFSEEVLEPLIAEIETGALP